MSGSARGPAPFSPLAAILLVLVGVFAFSAFVVLGAYAPDLQQGEDGGTHALSNSGVGFSALPEMMRFRGEPVLISRRPAPATSQASLLILTPDGPQDVAAMQEFHFSGPMLIILPKWDVVPHSTHTGWVRRTRVGTNEELAPFLAPYERETVIGHRAGVVRPVLRAGPHVIGATGEMTSLQTISGAGWTPVITDEAGNTVLARSTKHASIYVLADPDLMNNWGMRDLATARAAEAMLDEIRDNDGAVVFDISLNGFGGNRDALRLMFDPPFLAVTLCLFGAAILMGIHAVARFGPMRDAGRVFAFGKSVLADNTAALVRLAGREATMAPRYVQLEKSLAARALAAPKDLSPEAVTDFLDRMSRQREAADTLSTLTQAASTVTGRGDLLSIAQRLHRWRLEMTREHQ